MSRRADDGRMAKMDREVDALCADARAIERETVRMLRSIPGYVERRTEERKEARLAALKTSTTKGEGGMRVKTVAIDADVEQVLRAARLEGNRLVLEGQLTTQMYKKVMKVLELIGFKWSRGQKCHVGEGDSADRLREALAGGKVVDEKQTYQFFETPGRVAARMADLAGIRPGHRVLEPSAGKGAIIDAVMRACPGLRVVFACDIDPKNVAYLKAADAERSMAAETGGGYQQVVVEEGDFLKHGEQYDRIVMNPPFTADQSVRHVRHAYSLLNPGGRLVSIMDKGWLFGSNKTRKEFRDWYAGLQSDGLASIPEELPPGVFKESGTNVETILVVISRK